MNLSEFSATGDVVAQGGSAFLKQVVLTPAAAIASVVVRTAGASGTRKLTLQAPANGESVVVRFDGNGVLMTDGIHITVSGAGALVDVGWN